MDAALATLVVLGRTGVAAASGTLTALLGGLLVALALTVALLLALGVLTITLGLLGSQLLGDLRILLQDGFLAGEADALGFGVDFQNLAANHVAHVQDIFHLGNTADIHLRDVDPKYRRAPQREVSRAAWKLGLCQGVLVSPGRPLPRK